MEHAKLMERVSSWAYNLPDVEEVLDILVAVDGLSATVVYLDYSMTARSVQVPMDFGPDESEWESDSEWVDIPF